MDEDELYLKILRGIFWLLVIVLILGTIEEIAGC